MCKATAVVHASPAIGARFTQYTAEMEPDGWLGPAEGQRFVYVLEGELWVDGQALGADAYADLPEGCAEAVVARASTRVAVIEKPYQRLEGADPPARFVADERTVEPKPILGDADLQMRSLLPENPSFDFSVSTLTYQPGATLPLVEMHVMEHGLLMLAGGGIYRLGEQWYPVTAGDFIWMAPYCAQWFGALGKTPAKYLLYKDWNR